MRLILEEQQEYLQFFINNATYHPINPDADVSYQRANLFSSDKCFLITSFLMSHITFDGISTAPYNSGKGRYTLYMWSNDMFILWNRICAIFYEDKKILFTHFSKTAHSCSLVD